MPVTRSSGTPQALQTATPLASTAPRIPPQRQFAIMPTNNAPKPDHALVARFSACELWPCLTALVSLCTVAVGLSAPIDASYYYAPLI